MIDLKSLMDLLPYYFREQDTYKVNGKGLLERYLDIFGTYFDNDVVKDINTLDDIIDIDKTSEVYLGYLWEFLGSMPYANPQAIDPDKWKHYFNGFDNDSTIESLSKLWLYRKDYGDYSCLKPDQVRSLIKYSVALFSIRGTIRFFEVLLRLYGFEAIISNGSTYPPIITEDDDDDDYGGSDTDYYGNDGDYGGSVVDRMFEVKSEVTKIDSEWSSLDSSDTLDNHYNCTKIVNVNFKLKGDKVYDVDSNEFKYLQGRMFNLINMFLPIGTRPHLIWDNVDIGNNFVDTVLRSIEVYIDRTPIDWTVEDDDIVRSSEYPGWYKVNSSTIQEVKEFSWSQLRFMVIVKDNTETKTFTSDQPKNFRVAFNGADFSDNVYESGHIFTVKPGCSNYYPKFMVNVLCNEDFDLTNGIVSTFGIVWKKYFNYTIFKHYNGSVDLKLSNSNNYIPVLIQSAFVRTYTNDANPDDDDFIPKQVVNITTGNYLTLCKENTLLPDRDGNQIDYSQYKDRCMYVEHLFEPGVYEFAMLDSKEYRFSIEVTTVDEILTLSLIDGQENIIIDYDNPTATIKLQVNSNLDFLNHEDDLIIKESTNPVSRYWNNKADIVLSEPGHYRFYGVNPNKHGKVTSRFFDINVLSRKYNTKYFLELSDGDKADDEIYMLRTLIPSIPNSGSLVSWNFDFLITLNKSVLEAQDIMVVDPNAFDFDVYLYRGGDPNRGKLIGSWSANMEIIEDDLNNILPNYKVKGTISLLWDGTYEYHYIDDTNINCPPGLYCVELHDNNNIWDGSPSYRVLDAYVVPQKFDGNLYFDVDVISKAWTSPAGQVYNIDPLTGKYTWGWYKTHEDYLHSVRLVRYDPTVDTPQFRLKLTNNVIGYTRVYMYKLVENGNEWDSNAYYPKVLPPTIKSTTTNSGMDNPHWLNEATPKEWGFPGEYDDENDVWDYGKGSTGVPNYSGRWLFTGSIYQLGEIITGPQEPGKYLFLINQLDIDTKIINYVYLEVKEEIQYSIIVDPLLAILQGTAVGTKIDVISSAKFTKEILEVRVINPDGSIIEGYYQVPYAFYAYRPGTYTFELFKFENGQHINLGLTASFKVLTDNGISDEYLNWAWSEVSEKEVQVVTTSPDIEWSVRVQTE